MVSLNFDSHWLAQSVCWSSTPKTQDDLRSVRGRGQALQSELLRLNCFVTLPRQDAITRRLWFPNGYLGNGRSMRLGLREFGFQPVAIHEAFQAVKTYERRAGGFEQCRGWVKQALEGQATLNPALQGLKLPLTWVTEMLYRPVCFAGVGLSDAEFGLWWLMVQRARNLARVSPAHRPPVAILVKDDDARLGFWRTQPCGIKPLICATWDEGWEAVQAWGRGDVR